MNFERVYYAIFLDACWNCMPEELRYSELGYIWWAVGLRRALHNYPSDWVLGDIRVVIPAVTIRDNEDTLHRCDYGVFCPHAAST